MTATVQGWTLSIVDEARTPILTNVFTDKIEVEYDSDRFEYGMNRENRFQTTNFYRHGTIQIELEIPQNQALQWNNYLERMFARTEFRKASVTLEAGGNNAQYDNAILTSVNWGMSYTDDDQTTTEMIWRFSGVTNVVALPPREFRKPVKLQNLDWKVYGF